MTVSEHTLPVDESRPLSSTDDEMTEKEEQPSAPGAEAPREELARRSTAASHEADYVTGWKLYMIIAGVSLCTFLMLLDTSILATAIPVITNDFHSLSDIEWYTSTYQLALSALQPLTGKIFTYFKLKWSFLTFLGLFELGSLLCGVAVSSKMLIAGRAVAGIGGSGLFNGGLTIIAACVPMHKRPTITSIVVGLGQLGVVAGPLVGGALTEYTTWRWCFYINLPIGGVAALLLLFTYIPERADKPTFKAVVTDPNVWHKFDLTGTLMFAPTVVMLLLALQFGDSHGYGWSSATVIGLFCGFGGLLIVFLGWEYYAAGDAMIPFSMMRKQVVWASCVSGLFSFGISLCHSYFIPIYFQSVKGAKPLLSGVYTLPTIVSSILSGVLCGVLVGKFGYYLPFLVLNAILFAVGSGLMSTFGPGTSTGQWIGYQIIAGIGRGAGTQQPMIAIQTVLSSAQVPVGMALVIFSQNLGSAIFVAVANTLFDNALKTELIKKAPHVDAAAVMAAGATAFRKFVPAADLPGVLSAYGASLDNVFYLCVGLSGGLFLSAWGTGWNDVREKKKQQEAAAEASEA